MKLSILLPDLRGGGAERVNLNLAHEFARLGHQVEFVLLKTRGELLAEAQAAFPVTELGVDRFRSVPLALARYLRRRRPNALLAAMWPLTVTAPLARAISGHRCILVVSEHAMLSHQYRHWGRHHGWGLRLSLAAAYRMVDARVGVSSGVLADMSRLAWMDAASGHVVYNPVPDRAAPSVEALAEADALWGGPRGARVLSVGSFKAVKNHALLMRAFAHLESDQARLMFVGVGTGEISLRTLAKDLGIEDRMIFAGFRSDPTPFYMTADLFALSSDHEGFGNVIVEALACGTPVVSTDCASGPAEILENGRWGRLVAVGDVEALAGGMRETLSAAHDRDALKRRAADFAPAIAAERYLDLLLQRRSGATAAHPQSA